MVIRTSIIKHRWEIQLKRDQYAVWCIYRMQILEWRCITASACLVIIVVVSNYGPLRPILSISFESASLLP